MEVREFPLPRYNWFDISRQWRIDQEYKRKRFLYLERKVYYEIVDIEDRKIEFFWKTTTLT